MRVSGGRIKSLFRGEQEGAGYAFPAFWDGHGHVLGYGEMVQSVKLYGAGSVDGASLLLPGDKTVLTVRRG